jgi:HK97 family phage portal protein
LAEEPRRMNPVAWLMEKALPAPEQKAIIGLNDPISQWANGGVSRQDGTNFRTNQVTLAEYEDRIASGEAGALALSSAWACVNLLSGTQASLPLMVYRTINGQRTVAADHNLYRILHDSPNADQTSMDFWGFKTACIELRGNSYSEIERRGDGSVIALSEPLVPELVQVRRLNSGALEYKVHRKSRVETIPQDRMLHIRGFGSSSLGGLSTLSFAFRTLNLQHSINTAASATFRNGIRSSVAVEVEHKLSPEQVRESRQMIAENYQGAINAGMPFLAHGGMKIKPLSINPEEAQMLESRAFGVEEICRFFGVPPFMIGHTEKSTSWGTGLEQQLLTVQDKLDGVVIEFNLEGLLRADSGSRSKFYGEMSRIGAMTINEIRALENLPPVEGGDVPRMQSQNVPITETPSLNGDENEGI